MKQFFGKYRGKVTGNKDPSNLGRIQVSVAAIFGQDRQSWALPCTPYAGKDIGFFTVPPVDANVWVEFEGGDPDYPIWSGCFWGENELPQNAKVEDPVNVQVFKTEGITITLSNLEKNKALTVEVTKPVVEKPLKLIFNAQGIELNNDNKTIAKLTAETIELKNGESSTLTIAGDSIQLKESAIEIKLTANSIEMDSNPATLKLSTSSGIEIANPPAKALISSSGVELSSTPGNITVAPSGIELNYPIGNIKLSPVGVNVNNGALEVM
ncbi:hypothetical protein Cri9333_1125 [Crinalium epipsammum PCC 9333]|uniref:Gp5/Type VI secretion system Vgr protein OB-fold domain-containing protein n=1 Tax=Crinalium epipsammum PCC 9333 TaxID=1173022 RepID=K9VWX0_9CYAN|nr:phage baseplate assembly protein V [Crinalium epipsammum]AFZ12034.1 hypothetical protein Cri9333_1125 [Crinalium epipsammum PCC 9333]